MMLTIEDGEGVRVLLMDRAPANALSREMLSCLLEAVRDAGRDKDVRCILLGSTVPKYFSSGLDLEDLMSRPPEDRFETFSILMNTHRELATFPGPTLACIRGSAILAGWILAMACDFRWLSRKSGRIALSEVKLGMPLPEFLLRRLAQICGSPSLVREMVLRARALRSEEAFRGGFADRLEPDEEVFDQCLREARRLAKLPRAAYSSIKAGLSSALGPDPAETWDAGMRSFKNALSGPGAWEGIEAMQSRKGQ